MDVREAIREIRQLVQNVQRREHLRSLFSHAALTLLIGGALAAAVVVIAKMRPTLAASWALAAGVMSLAVVAFAARWYLTRLTEDDVTSKVDRALQLEDRLLTAYNLLARRAPTTEMEAALIDDTAARLRDAKVSALAPYRFTRLHGLSLIGGVALMVALLIPQTALPGGAAIAEERADIQAAGEMLEQVASEVTKELPAESETAKLATEQAELGRALRRSNDTRAEALKKIGNLENRIRERHDYLSNTRANEIVAMAERRLRSALAKVGKPQSEQLARAESRPADAASEAAKSSPVTANPKGDEKPPASKAKPAPVAADTSKPPDAASASSNANRKGDAASDQGQATTPPSKPEGRDNRNNALNPPRSSGEQPGSANSETTTSTNPQKGEGGQPATSSEAQPNPTSGQSASAETATTGDQGAPNQPKPDEAAGQPNSLTGAMTGEALKAAPNLSGELMKQAAQMRLGQLKPEDIKNLQASAQELARDLSQLAQSKEFQQAVEQFVRNASPEQLEQMARSLLQQEQLKKELEATARLLAENRQIREMAAGIAKQLEDRFGQRDERAQSPNRTTQGGNPPTGQASGEGTRGNGRGNGAGTGKGSSTQPLNPRLTGQGKATQLSGSLQNRQGGEYLFLQSSPTTGASRLPYSSAYPRYRRAAERSVERSQIPTHLRGMIRDYFDVINPDAGKKN